MDMHLTTNPGNRFPMSRDRALSEQCFLIWTRQDGNNLILPEIFFEVFVREPQVARPRRKHDPVTRLHFEVIAADHNGAVYLGDTTKYESNGRNL